MGTGFCEDSVLRLRQTFLSTLIVRKILGGGETPSSRAKGLEELFELPAEWRVSTMRDSSMERAASRGREILHPVKPLKPSVFDVFYSLAISRTSAPRSGVPQPVVRSHPGVAL